MVYEYFINLDERGEFFADLRNTAGETVLEIRSDFFEDGWMRHGRDLRGLSDYAVMMDIVKKNDEIVFGN